MKWTHGEDRNTIGLSVTLCLLTRGVATVTRVLDEGHSHVINNRYSSSHTIQETILHPCASEDILPNHPKKKSHTPTLQRLIEFSLNAFTEFSDKQIKIKKENCRVGTLDLLCERQKLYHSATEPQATEQSLVMNTIHASVISQIL